MNRGVLRLGVLFLMALGACREELHEVEEGLFRRLQQLGRVMLERFVAVGESGTGHMGGQPPCTLAGELLTYKSTQREAH